MSPPEGVVRLRLSSTLQVDAAGDTLAGRNLGSRKARTLLALLASVRGRAVATDHLVEVLWADRPPADPAANVATIVSRLRRTVGRDLVVGLPGAYALGGSWSLDLAEAEQLCAQAASRSAAGQHAVADAAAAAAQELLGTGTALLDEDDDGWVVEVRREADALRREARHHRVVALTALDSGRAVAMASAGTLPDPYDERAVRDLMRALAADGQATAALEAYDRLAGTLREELGTEPDRATADLQVTLLRAPGVVEHDEVAPASAQAPPPMSLVGRDHQLALVRQAWDGVLSDGHGELLLVVGEGGIGKTRLLDAVAATCVATGGAVLRGRCHPAERSLFLQPFVDALRPALAGLQLDRLHAVVRDHEAAWASLVPDLGPVLRGAPASPADRDLQRRATYDALLAALRRLSVTQPLVLLLDDLQDAGAATIDLLGYLAGQLQGSRVLMVGAVRSEDPTVAERLGDRARTVRLRPLDASAVDALAAAAGLATHGRQVMARTAGHTLSVVESLRALADGDAGVPASLSAAVLARVERLETEERSVVEAGAVLRRRLDPRLLAALTEMSEVSATRHGEDLTRSGLFVRSGAVYEFANDLFQECVYAALPEAVAAAYHRRAADLTTDRPEVMAAHAHAVGDDLRAARAWLLAGEEALRRAAVEDARALVERVLSVRELAGETRARALLVRGRVHEAGMSWTAALEDIDAALATARGIGERRLELAALRARGGDAAVGAQLVAEDLLGPLEDGVRLAAELGDRRAEADFASRLVVLGASQLRLGDARVRAERVLSRARAASSQDGVVLALDGIKTVAWYLGDAPVLAAAVEELEPLLQERADAWLIQWVVFESAFVPAAYDRWDEADERMSKALDLNRRSGFPAYAGYLMAYQGWLARLAGDLEGARRLGYRAVEATSAVDHPWWHSWAAGLLAATLVETGDRAEAEVVARAGLVTRSGTAQPGGLLCAAALASLTGEGTRAAAAALSGVDCPPGHAWVLGADAYLLLAGAAAERGDDEEADRLIAPLRAATDVVVAVRPAPGRGAGSEHLQHHPGGALGTVGGDRQVVHGLRQAGDELLGDVLGVGVGVRQRPSGAVPVQSVPHVHLLLEVVLERHVEERALRGGQLHRGAEAALHDGHVAGGVVQVEVGQEPAYLDAVRHVQRVPVHARTGHHDHAQARDPRSGRLVRRGDAPQQVVSDPRSAHGHEADHVALAVAEPRTQLVTTTGVRSLTHHVAGEVEVTLGPVAGGRQPGPERQVDDVVGVAHEDGPVTKPGGAGDVLDHLGVVVRGQVRLPLTAVGHRHPADEIGHPDERRPLQGGVLVEEVVEVPGLVAHPQVEGLPLDQVVEDHEVVDQDLVHAAYGVEGVQVVLAGLRLEVAGLAGQQP